MSHILGIPDEITSDIRLNGIGWLGGVLVVGASILAARLVMHLLMRRVERVMARKEAEEAAKKSALTDEHERPSA
jgi:hypothetical protein